MNGNATVTIQGKATPIKFGYPAVKWFFEAIAEKSDIMFIEQSLTVEGWAKLIQCGYNNHCYYRDKEPEHNFADFVEYVEEAMQSEAVKEELNKALEAYGTSIYYKKMIEKSDNVIEEIKKNSSLTETQLMPSFSENLATGLGNSTELHGGKSS